MKKVVIVGGGVVGLHLAKRLCELEIEVEVHDSKKEISDGAAKASGILSIKGLKSTGIDYEGSQVNVLNGAYLNAGKRQLKIRSKEPMAYVLDRAKLAKKCKDAAIEAGADVILGSKIDSNELIELEGKGNIIVGADGAVSTVAKTFKFPPIEDYVLTYKAEFEDVAMKEKDMVGLYFSGIFAKGLFGWHVPYSNNTVELGLGIGHKNKLNSKKAFERFVDGGSFDFKLSGGTKIGEHASIIPISSRKSTVIGNVALVGDAAGQVKATTGGGLIYGCLCAKELAKSIKSNIDKGTPLSAYETMWRKRYGKELVMHRMVHSYYSKAGDRGLGMAFGAIRAMGLESFLGKYGDMDKPSLILKRFVLRGLSS